MPKVEDPTVNLRENLRKFRKLRGMTQTQMGSKSLVGAASISHFETGQRTPTIKTLVKLADALDVTVDALLGRSPIERAVQADPIFRRASPTDAQTLETMRRIATVILEDVNNSAAKRDHD